MKGGILTERKVQMYDDLRVPLKKMVQNKGTIAKAARAIGYYDGGQTLSNVFSGTKGISFRRLLALLDYLGYTIVLHRTSNIPKATSTTPEQLPDAVLLSE